MNKAIVSSFYGNSLDESQKKSIMSFREHAPGIPYYLIALNRVDDAIPQFCLDNDIKLIDPGHVADIRNHTLSRLQAYTQKIISQVSEDFIIMVGLDMFCTTELPLEELDETKINICIDTVAAEDFGKWVTHTKARLSKKVFKIDFMYVNSGLVAFSKSAFGVAMESVYEMACTDFYSVAVKDINCYESDYLNYFLWQQAAVEDIKVLNDTWNTLYTLEDSDNAVDSVVIKHIVPDYDYRVLLTEIPEQIIPVPVPIPVIKPVIVIDKAPVETLKEEYDRKYGHLFIDGKYPPREDVKMEFTKPEIPVRIDAVAEITPPITSPNAETK